MLTPLFCLLAASVPWTQFRGPNGQGETGNASLPLTWSENDNVVWKTPLPGKGWSSPVICENQAWMTAATDDGRTLHALGVALDTGKLLHNVTVFQRKEPVFVHAKNSHASPTPVIEPGRVYVNFGTAGTACLDTKTGAVLWRSEELQLEHAIGPGSSPLLYRGLFIVNCDGSNTQYVAALDTRTGKLAWKTPRSGTLHDNPDCRKANGTCAIANVAGKDQLISQGADWVYAYEPLTGKELWRCAVKGFSNVPVPVLGDGLIYVCTGFGRPHLWAIRPDNATVVWKYEKPAPAIPSPVRVGGEVYFITDSGVAICLDARTGEERWREVLRGAHAASPLHNRGRIYFFSETGKTTVVAASPQFKLLETNQLDGKIMATPAVVDNAFILRADTALYRIEQRR
ncbi:MAG: pyrrolo-quinoline quinone [Verrucomicrobia bacterium]|nr:pyrrolo-quinoline quinone [Verrucomicrobiota bacterium]